MQPVPFDTLKFSERLAAAGVPPAQAKAEADALRDALAESRGDSIAIRADVADLKADLTPLKADIATLKADVAALKADVAAFRLDFARIDGRLTLLQWMLGVVVAGTLALVLKAFF